MGAREIDRDTASDASAGAGDDGYRFIHLDFSVADSAASMALEISRNEKVSMYASPLTNTVGVRVTPSATPSR